ncbi:MAG: DUF1761 domain-containing protein [Sphingomonas sp.]|jgi:hypothetical protein|uniref:DUF1761 domain-containing protein n=1 Tax=Sphingomonas sp. TaxID=28214 RepID=UPI003567FA8A
MGTEVHWLAILVAAVSGFLVGGLWYGPIFGKAWQAARGLSDDAMKNANMPMIFGLTFLLNLFSAFILDHTLTTYGAPDLSLSVMISSGVALGFIVPAIGVNYLFSRQSLRLFMIDAGYWLVIYSVMGVVFALL